MTLLDYLRHYWLSYRPVLWLFPNAGTPSKHLTLATAQKAFKKAKNKTGIEKIGGIHSLPHELNGWVQLHPEVIYDLLFQIVWHTLKTFAVDLKHLDGRLSPTDIYPQCCALQINA